VCYVLCLILCGCACMCACECMREWMCVMCWGWVGLNSIDIGHISGVVGSIKITETVITYSHKRP